MDIIMQSMRLLIEAVENGGAHRLNESVTTKEILFYHGTKSAPFDSFKPTTATKGEQFYNPLGSGLYVTNSRRYASYYGTNVHKVIIPPGSTYRRITLGQWATSGAGLVMRAVKSALKACGEDFDHWRYGKPVALAKMNVRKMTREQMVDFIAGNYAKQREMTASEEEIRKHCDACTDERVALITKNLIANRPVTTIPDKTKRQAVDRFLAVLYREMERNSPRDSLTEAVSLVHQTFGEQVGEAFQETLPKMADALFKRWDFVIFTESEDTQEDDGAAAQEVVIFNPALQKTVADDTRR